MANYNIYFSPTGGTWKVADVLVRNLWGEYANIDLCKEVSPLSLSGDDVCLVSVPSYGGRVPAIALERLQRIKGNGARAVLNCVYGNREWEDTLTELQDTLEALGFRCVAAVAAVAEHSVFRQYATGRPDADDKTQLAAFSKQIQERLDEMSVQTLICREATEPTRSLTALRSSQWQIMIVPVAACAQGSVPLVPLMRPIPK